MEKKKIKIFIIVFCFISVVVGSLFLTNIAEYQATYDGLPTVPCIDTTKPLKQNFTLTIQLFVDNKKYLLDPSIGHDYGDCLHNIFTNDTSGKVHIQSNNIESLTLGQFFDVWHKTFSEKQLMQYAVGENGSLKVLVNEKSVTTFRETILKPSEEITIIYSK